MFGNFNCAGDCGSTQINSRKRIHPSNSLDKNIPAESEGPLRPKRIRTEPNVGKKEEETNSKCGKFNLKTVGIDQLPPEVLLHIFKYLPQDCLFGLTRVCRYWKNLSLDFSLWNSQRVLTLGAVAPSTEDARTILHHARNVQRLNIYGRNDIDKLLNVSPIGKPKLKSIIVEHCLASQVFHRTLSFLVAKCPNLRTVIIKSTNIHGLIFYRTLAQNYSKMDYVKVSCTSKAEMWAFIDFLRIIAPHLHFREVAMMGHIDQKRIYWGPILGLVFTRMPSILIP